MAGARYATETHDDVVFDPRTADGRAWCRPVDAG